MRDYLLEVPVTVDAGGLAVACRQSHAEARGFAERPYTSVLTHPARLSGSTRGVLELMFDPLLDVALPEPEVSADSEARWALAPVAPGIDATGTSR